MNPHNDTIARPITSGLALAGALCTVAGTATPSTASAAGHDDPGQGQRGKSLDGRKPTRPAPSLGGPANVTGAAGAGGAVNATTLEELEEEDPEIYAKLMEQAEAKVAERAEEDDTANTDEDEDEPASTAEDDPKPADTGTEDDDATNTRPASFAALDAAISPKMPGRDAFIATCQRDGLTLDAARDRAIDTLASAVKRKPAATVDGEDRPLASSPAAVDAAADPLGIGSAKTFDEAVDLVMKSGKGRVEAVNAIIADPVGAKLREKSYGR